MSNRNKVIHTQELFNSFACIYNDLEDQMVYYQTTLGDRKRENEDADFEWYVARIEAYGELLKFIEKKLGI